MWSGEKIRTKTNYWSENSQRSSENIYEDTLKYTFRQPAAREINIFQLWSFLYFLSKNGYSSNSEVK